MEILLETEGDIIKHSFFCKVLKGTKEVIIKNARKSKYSKGWQDYSPFESSDGKVWTRTKPGKYNGEEFLFKINDNSTYICWYPPYRIDKIKEIGTDFINSEENIMFIGDNNKPKIVLLSGQHPGESMGLYFIEGVLNALNENKNILNNYSFIIFPTINLEGLKANNHRLTPQGIDLNRMWKRNCVELKNIKEILKNINNIYAVIDVHGDEVSKRDYIIYNHKFKGSFLEKVIIDNSFIPIKKENDLKKFIKNIIRHKKIIFERNNTARDFMEEHGLMSITMEISAFNNIPERCVQMGYKFASTFERC